MQTGKPRRFMNACLHCLVLLGPALLLSCTDPQAENGLAIKGSTTVLPIVQVAAEVYMDRHPEAELSVQGGGSGVGIASLIDGTTRIATSSRRIKDQELVKARESGITIHETVIAMDGIAVVVNPSNNLQDLTIPQIRDIYTGAVSNWRELGGKDLKIVVLTRDTSSGTFEAFETLALDGEKVRPDALVTASNQVVNMTVAQTPGAIGYLGFGYVSEVVRAVRIDGAAPGIQSIRSGRYPLSRPLYIYTRGMPAGEAKRFLDFLLSEEGQRLVREQGFIDVR
ncbi:MAG: PstS family phosphate ABC transporter substrate-binding protein [Desulfomonilia bacterium]|jgi:phosphate transport system substrate-binding protein